MAHTEEVDVIVVGGGPAGLSAALYAGRARRTVAVVDRGAPRNAVSPGVHNLLTRDGTPPAELRRLAWEELAPYAVRRIDGTVRGLRRDGDRWVADYGESALVGRAVLLAVGVLDELPAWPGLAEKWGHSVHFCPYCHGWELRDQPLATVGHGDAIAHFGPLLAEWSRDVVVLAGDDPLAPETEAILQERGIPVRRASVAALEGPGHELTAIRLTDGTRLERRGLFVMSRQRQVPLVRELGLQMQPFPTNPDGLVVIDEHQRTSAPMLWAAGDLASFRPQVVEAAAAGARAGASIHATLALGA